MKSPLLYPLIGLMAGILVGDDRTVPFFLLLGMTSSVLLLLLVSVRQKWNKVSLALILIFLFMVGCFNIQKQQYLSFKDMHIVHQADRGILSAEGTILSIAPLSPSQNALIVGCRRILTNNSYLPATGNIRLVTPAPMVLQYGDLIRFHASIKKIQSFHNPGSFSYEQYLKRRGIYVAGFVANSAGIALIRHDTASALKLKLEDFRSSIKHLIDAHAPSPQKEILQAMTIGNAKAIPQSIRDNFSKTGTSHLLAISGLHIGMVAATGFFLVLLMLKSSEYFMLKFNIIKVATLAAFVPVIFYALVAGMSTTVNRATLMALAFLASLLLEKQRNFYNILFGAALFILIIAPESLFDISFQLSFSAVFAILFIVPKFIDLPSPIRVQESAVLHKIFRHVYVFMLVSAAATLGTLPILVYYFNQFSTVTLITNLIAVPILGMLSLIPALASIPAAFFSDWFAGVLIQIAAFFSGIAVWFISWLASLPWSSLTFIKPNIEEIILFYIFLFFLIRFISPETKWKDRGFLARHPSLTKSMMLITLSLILADSVYLFCKDRFSDGITMTAIDVGQGSSTLVRLPRGMTILIDGGGFYDGSFDMGRSVIAPFLYAQRIRKIDIAVLTHPHPDHLQGLIHIVDAFNVQEVWCTGIETDDDLYRLWKETLTKRGVKIKHLSRQSPSKFIFGVEIHCLWPFSRPVQTGASPSYDETNDSSLVMKITYGTTSFLVTGDISDRVESLLIRSGQNLKSDLLFVPHHGSLHSSSSKFIGAVSCRYAVISAGKNNVFRHPHPAVLNRYESAGVNVFRTDQDGAISIQSDGKTLTITPFLKKQDTNRQSDNI